MLGAEGAGLAPDDVRAVFVELGLVQLGQLIELLNDEPLAYVVLQVDLDKAMIDFAHRLEQYASFLRQIVVPQIYRL